MTHKKPNPKEANKRNIRTFSYLLFFYFGIRLLILPILAFQEEALDKVYGGKTFRDMISSKINELNQFGNYPFKIKLIEVVP